MNHQKKLQQKADLLNNIITTVQSRLQSVPNGRLRINRNGNRLLYYHCSKETLKEHSQGQYIPRSNKKLAEQLAQKAYHESVLEVAKQLLINIENSHEIFVENTLGSIYENLNSYRKELVTPLVLPTEEYARSWSEESFVGNPFHRENLVFLTERGEYVRSKSEKMIADKLYMMRIPYKYECPLQCNQQHTFYPDFTILNAYERKEYYLEHLGMLDNPEYAQAAVEKLNQYSLAGILQGDSLLITWETSKSPLDMRTFDALIRRFIFSQ